MTTKISRAVLLFGIGSAVIGSLLGGIVGSLVSGTLPGSGLESTTSGARGEAREQRADNVIGEIERLGRAVEDGFARLEELMGLVGAERSAIRMPQTEGIDDADAAPSEGAADEMTTPSVSASRKWLELIDEGIGRILVERGLDPFDPAVSPFVSKAAGKLHEIDRDYKECLRVPWQQFCDRQIDVVQYGEARKPFDVNRGNARRVVLQELINELENQGS